MEWSPRKIFNILRPALQELICLFVLVVIYLVIKSMHDTAVHDENSYLRTDCTVLSHNTKTATCTSEGDSDKTCYKALWGVEYRTLNGVTIDSTIDSFDDFQTEKEALEHAEEKKIGTVHECWYDSDPGEETDVDFEVNFDILIQVFSVILITAGVVMAMTIIRMLKKIYKAYKYEKMDEQDWASDLKMESRDDLGIVRGYTPKASAQNASGAFDTSKSSKSTSSISDEILETGIISAFAQTNDNNSSSTRSSSVSSVGSGVIQPVGENGLGVVKTENDAAPPPPEYSENDANSLKDVQLNSEPEAKIDEQEKILILVKTSEPAMKLGGHVSIKMLQFDGDEKTVGGIRTKISSSEGISQNNQKLMFSGSELTDDSQTFETIGLEEILYFVIIRKK